MIRGYRTGIRDTILPAHPLPHSTREQVRPTAGPLGITREKVRPATGPLVLTREKVRPARHKTLILGHFEHARRTFSRTGSCDVTTLKPMTPLQPLIQASMKPPSPLHAPEQQPLKPPSPLQPKNAPKTPISHPQRRCRFQLGLGQREQRRHRFHAKYPRHPHVATSPLTRKLARNSIG